MTRTRLPTDRKGVTRKYSVASVTLYITVNMDANGTPREVFGKCDGGSDDGHQGELDGLCILASIAMQHGASASTLADKLRGRRYPPHGVPGGPCSISDAVGRALEAGGAT